ncbi:MAG: glycosyltransferase family 39 protein [Ruminococcus sp.]|nr:glycosyltransferase family 39 protein [Ruminococcus sp.]
MVINVLKKAVIFVFVLIISIIIIDGPLNSLLTNTVALWLILPISAVIGLIIWAKKLFDKYENTLEKNFKLVFIIYLAVMFILQLVPVGTLRFVPKWDLDAVFGGAISWIKNGDLHEYNDYFLWFPNNFGLLTIYNVIFSIGHFFFGEKTDYYMIATVMACISLTATRFSIVMICKKLLGTTSSYLAMLIMLFCPVMYFMSAVFYTDVLSMWATPLAILLFIKAYENHDKIKKPLLYIASAVAATFGAEIKFTVIIIVIALAISLLIRGEFKELCIFGATHLVIFTIVFTSFNALYNANFDNKIAEERNTPILHWIMMGASENGSYNGEDYEFTRSFIDTDERDRAIKDELIKRYKNYGIDGTMNLWKAKTLKDFGDGTLGISDFLDDNVVKHSSLHEFLLYNGKHYNKWNTICTEYLLVMLIFMLLSVKKLLMDKKISSIQECIMLALYMCISGLWIFLMFWEASARYFSNFYGLILLGSVLGISIVIPKKESTTNE